jgi:hypothetical protein
MHTRTVHCVFELPRALMSSRRLHCSCIANCCNTFESSVVGDKAAAAQHQGSIYSYRPQLAPPTTFALLHFCECSICWPKYTPPDWAYEPHAVVAADV